MKSVNPVHLDQLVERIDQAFGSDMPFTDHALGEEDIATLNRVFADGGYQRYLQDQVNRQIIRDYLANAVVLNLVSEATLNAMARQVSSTEGRSELSLHMLMSSVEQVNDLPVGADPEPLKPLRGQSGTTSHLNLIRN